MRKPPNALANRGLEGCNKTVLANHEYTPTNSRTLVPASRFAERALIQLARQQARQK